MPINLPVRSRSWEVAFSRARAAHAVRGLWAGGWWPGTQNLVGRGVGSQLLSPPLCVCKVFCDVPIQQSLESCWPPKPQLFLTKRHRVACFEAVVGMWTPQLPGTLVWKGNVLGRAGSSNGICQCRFLWKVQVLQWRSLFACLRCSRGFLNRFCEACSLFVRNESCLHRHTGSADQCQILESSESKSHVESRHLKQSLCCHGAQRHPCGGEHRRFDGDGVPGWGGQELGKLKQGDEVISTDLIVTYIIFIYYIYVIYIYIHYTIYIYIYMSKQSVS